MIKLKKPLPKNAKSFKLGGEFYDASKIKYIAGEGNYSIIHFINGEKKLSCRTLKYYEALLKDIQIIRPSKSYLVHTAYIKSVELKSRKSIIMQDDFAIGISRRNVPLMKAFFNL